MSDGLNPLVPPRWDWMQETIREDPGEIAEVLAGTLGGELESGRGMNGYERSSAVVREGETLARVAFGGANGWPNVVASGPAAEDVTPVLREAWPGLRATTRFDSANDFDDARAFDLLSGLLRSEHERTGMYLDERQSVRRGVLSRTVYLGAPGSRVRIRCYEKGNKERQEGNGDASATWVRLEAQVRPDGQEARAAASWLSPAEAWGFSPTLRKIAAEALGLEVASVRMQVKRDPDYARAVEALRRQYGATLSKALAVEGSWEAVGRMLGMVGADA